MTGWSFTLFLLALVALRAGRLHVSGLLIATAIAIGSCAT